MRTVFSLLTAMICSAVGFTVQWREQWLPARPSDDALSPEHEGSWFHRKKNETTEWVRADAEWWSKFLCLIILIQFIIIIL